MKLGIGLDPAIFANAEKDEPVDRALDGEIQLVDGQLRIAQCEILCQGLAPGFDFLQKLGIDSRGAAFAVGDGMFVE